MVKSAGILDKTLSKGKGERPASPVTVAMAPSFVGGASGLLPMLANRWRLRQSCKAPLRVLPPRELSPGGK
ncbi:hypothetical protein Y032_0252g214 [Ancylostoma ceylanicum]|uniref:Uncharacterized protein n=1 Tax=Ancylostoma ceylanicum TaxID=53326 RepID=A0A016SBV1_9BILA|nr:hypothetical protein Y032_0252g214 [Ancylostoma ceylanicum]